MAAVLLATGQMVLARSDNSDKIAEAQRKLAEQCRAQPERCRDGPVTEPTGWKEYMKPNGGGSGFLVNKEGYVLTNYHVIEGCNAVTVPTADDPRQNAQLRATDKPNDLALLKISGYFPDVAQFRDS